MSSTFDVTMSGLMEQFAKMPTLTAKQASAYTCGPETYAKAKMACGITESCAHVIIGGIRIYPSQYTPDNGKFYPADYIESQVGLRGWPYEVAR